MALPPGIEINPKVMLGKPVIGGTRILVELLHKLGEETTERDLLDACRISSPRTLGPR